MIGETLVFLNWALVADMLLVCKSIILHFIPDIQHNAVELSLISALGHPTSSKRVLYSSKYFSNCLNERLKIRKLCFSLFCNTVFSFVTIIVNMF